MHTTLSESDQPQRPPRVTVLMPAYNVERFISQAIESVLAQTFKDFELLIIDDASTDETLAAAEHFAFDPKIRIVKHISNRGRPETRNHGLQIAAGEYIAFLDADDYCAPERLAKQVAYLDAHPEIGGVGSWKTWIDTDGQSVTNEIRKFPLEPDAIACQMIRECTLGQTSLMLRSSAARDYRYDTAFPYSEDYELWARMITTVQFANLPETLTYYRRHLEQSISAHKDEQEVATLAIYGKQIDKLGVAYDWDDLRRHERLLKFSSRESVLKRTGAPLDVDYLRWAEGWLKALRRGNAREHIYPEPAFSYMLAACWLFAARKAIRNSGPLIIIRALATSRLTAVAAAHPMHFFKLHRNRRELE